MKIYIVRHGQTNHNLKKIYSNEDEDLNLNGINQAKTLKEQIKKINYDIIISSPLIRAKHTANIINVKNTDILIDERLTERNPGSLNGISLSATNREEYWNYYTKINYGTAESIENFFNRVFDFLNELKNKDYDTVLIVAHSGVSKVFSGYFEGIQNGKFLNRGLKNCEINEYRL